MKNIKLIYIAILASLNFIVFQSCDDYLNELPPSTLIADNAITNQSSAQVALNGVYSYLGANGELVVYQIVDNALRCNFIEPNTGTLRGTYEFEVPAFAVEPTWATIKNLWVSMFRMINAANSFIDQVEALPDAMFSENKKNEMLAEAYFVRAWVNLYQMKMFCHFWDVTSIYGPLIRTEPSGLRTNHKARSTVAQGYEQIISDLEFAAEFGPDFYSVYRASKGVAKAYLIESLMLRGQDGDYARAATLADDVILNSGRTLNTTFAGIYANKWTSPELMFSRSVFDIDPAELGGMRPTIYSLLAIGGRNNPTDRYLSYFQPDDPRKASIIGTIVTSTATYENTWKKHFEADSDVPMRYMRLTQVYLFKAEALARTNAPAANVLEPINILRLRAGMETYPTNVNYTRAELFNIIFSELVVEIGVENGSEFFAAVRFRDASGLRFIKSINDMYTTDNGLALPIPIDELTFNPLMDQNPY
jgi:starch-binding outer membrane protein, SusD/RagB family